MMAIVKNLEYEQIEPFQKQNSSLIQMQPILTKE